MHTAEEAGGFVPNQPKSNFRRRGGPNRRPKFEKTSAERAAEWQAARERWSAEPAIVTVRQAIADSNLPAETASKLMASLANLEEAKLEALISSGKLDEIVAELEAARSPAAFGPALV